MSRRIKTMMTALIAMAASMDQERYNKHVSGIMDESSHRKGRGKGKIGSRFTKRTRGKRDASLRSRSRRSR